MIAMLGKSLTAAIVGIDAKIIDIEVDCIASQLPGLVIVGLPDKSVQEAKERIISAIKNSGYEWPRKKIVVNLAPADIQKTGTLFDLPIAMAVLQASDQIEFDSKNNLFSGELSLEGEVRKVSGSLSTALECKKRGIDNLFIPLENSSEAGLVDNINVYGIKKLSEIVNFFESNSKLDKCRTNYSDFLKNQNYEINFDHIKGQESVKRACIIAAAGSHNILLNGSPGSGKTLISRALVSILPDLTFEESLEITKIYSVSGLLNSDQSIINIRPFRSPHHTASTTSIIGGGKFPKPGELSLAHRGILFLDEFTEFPSFAVEALRQPIEDKKVVISRISGTLTFPANFMLVAAMNPCKCGWLGDLERECTCTPYIIEKYKKKISGPILDRIDLHISVKRVKTQELISDKGGIEETVKIKELVQSARNLQLERYKDYSIYSNNELNQKMLEKFCFLDSESKDILNKASEKYLFSARSYFRIIKVARTIADLELSDVICKRHIAEALQYRINE